MKQKKTLLFLLLMISFVFTTGTFAYWASYVEGTTEEAIETLTIGSAEGVDTDFVLSNESNTGGLLVPSNHLLNSGNYAVDSIILGYDIKWIEDEEISQLEGTITTGEIKVTHKLSIQVDGNTINQNEYQNIYDLINVYYYDTNPTMMTLEQPSSSFYFEIKMDEPSNQAEYNLIRESIIIVTFSFDINDSTVKTIDLQDVIYNNTVVLNGEAVVYVELGSEYIEEGMTAYDSIGNEITDTWINGGVNTYELGVYELTYQGYSNYDNEIVESKTRTVIVVDTTAPNIVINGDETFYVKLGSYYSDWGAWALDTNDGSIEVKISGIEEVDINTAGTYFVTYTAKDSIGNEAIAVRTVIVE